MPRAVQTPEEINVIRDRILDIAAQLIIEEGFNKLSMRKIASRLGITATNIYYYFTNKDEININIRTRGFHMLYEKQRTECSRYQSPVDKFRVLVWVFVNFGTNNPDYYDIMYNLRTPKYTNYIGTEFEKNASFWKSTSIKTLEITIDILTDLNNEKIENLEGYLENKYKAIKLWSDLHGIISIYNSRVLFETAENDKEILDRRVNDIINETISPCTTKLS
jgi:AcrR family transcriptional regulator